ncbi:MULTISPECIES: hypothetical protein [Streptomyces]|uniref:Uncharacterized protein n=2 Tax=Streptomyces TaxID=1883 RepID=A0A117IW71_9ACTN|nr:MULTISPECIES: hypothetical protein [Streptomyces]KUH38570.1 hypothetical protein ATE80_11870 [Streptomyces kanasensis]UUS33948.1 hypothetical protein NRO40_26080 [Streptomyces changanensis]
MGTPSFVARPTDPATGSRFRGVYCLFDGYPDHQLPLLLGALRYRFAGDLDALRRHLLDAPHDWQGLGVDLLEGAPDHVLKQLDPHAERFPSMPLTDVFTPSGEPAEPIPITERSTGGDLEWGYILHDQGIEVIALPWYDRGPLVSWSTSPLARIHSAPLLWAPDKPAPVQAPRTGLTLVKPPGPAPASPARRPTR